MNYCVQPTTFPGSLPFLTRDTVRILLIGSSFSSEVLQLREPWGVLHLDCYVASRSLSSCVYLLGQDWDWFFDLD